VLLNGNLSCTTVLAERGLELCAEAMIFKNAGGDQLTIFALNSKSSHKIPCVRVPNLMGDYLFQCTAIWNIVASHGDGFMNARTTFIGGVWLTMTCMCGLVFRLRSADL